MCGQLTAKRPEIRGAVLLMPCDIGRLPQIKEEDPAAYRTICPVLCAGGTLDIYTPPKLHREPLARAVRQAGGTLFQELTYPTDHFFADYRLTVAAAVTDFLRRLLAE